MYRNAPYMVGGGGALTPPPPSLLDESRRQLLQQTQQGGQPAAGADPDYQMYGIFGPQYAASLARPSGATGGDLLNRTALMLNTEQEEQAYADALEAAQRGAMERARLTGHYNVLGQIVANDGTPVLGGTRSLGTGASGEEEVVYDPITHTVDNQLRGNASVSASRERNASAVARGAEAGIRTPVDTFSGYMTAPTQATPDRYDLWTPDQLTPEQHNTQQHLPIDQFDAESRRISAEAQRYAAEHGDDQGYVSEMWQPGATEPIVTVRRPGSVPPAGTRPTGNSADAPHAQQGMSGVQDRIRQNTVRAGGSAQMSGSILVVIGPQGQRYMFDQNGQQVHGGGPTTRSSGTFPQ